MRTRLRMREWGEMERGRRECGEGGREREGRERRIFSEREGVWLLLLLLVAVSLKEERVLWELTLLLLLLGLGAEVVRTGFAVGAVGVAIVLEVELVAVVVGVLVVRA